MKKLLLILTGIVFLTAILIVGGCKSSGDNGSKKPPNTVKIYMQCIEKDDGKHLLMYDSNDPDNVVVDSLITHVQPGMKVIWKLERPSGIKKINKIGSAKGVRNIFKKDARPKLIGKGFVLKLSDELSDGQEKYIIEFFSKKDPDDLVPIDPFLRIP